MAWYATWLADVLRAAGLQVVDHAGWQGRSATNRDGSRAGGLLRPDPAVVLHHDASPPGDSPGVVAYMLRQADTPGGSWAQCWVSRAGVWHVLAAGIAWHAGPVLPGMPGNGTSLGVETDHTEGEAWPPAQVDALRRGSAAILARSGRSASALHMHKTLCDPPGRKTDPAGLDLATERAAVAALMAPTQEDDIMATIEDLRAVLREEVMDARISRDGMPGDTSLRQTLASLDVNLSRVLASTDPRAIAAAIPDDIAADVLAALADRLKP